MVEYPPGWTCAVTVTRLEGYLVERLPRHELLAVAEHLHACPSCHGQLEVLRVHVVRTAAVARDG